MDMGADRQGLRILKHQKLGLQRHCAEAKSYRRNSCQRQRPLDSTILTAYVAEFNMMCFFASLSLLCVI
jgi:hypothetical protein